MQLHLILLGLSAAVAVAAIAASPGHACRPASSFIRHVGPFALAGFLASMLLSAHGAPTVEWLVPMGGMAVAWLFCTSDRVLGYGRTALLLLAGLLIANFLGLTGPEGSYTADPAMTARALRASRREGDIQPLWHTALTRLHRVATEPEDR